MKTRLFDTYLGSLYGSTDTFDLLSQKTEDVSKFISNLSNNTVTSKNDSINKIRRDKWKLVAGKLNDNENMLQVAVQNEFVHAITNIENIFENEKARLLNSTDTMCKDNDKFIAWKSGLLMKNGELQRLLTNLQHKIEMNDETAESYRIRLASIILRVRIVVMSLLIRLKNKTMKI